MTPLDVHNKVFKKSLRGYDQDEVDDFLDEVMKDFESLYKENLDLKEELVKEKESIRLYKDMEDTLQKTMVLAQRMSEEARINAEKESELIIAQARKRAEEIIYRQENLRTFEKQMVVRLKNFLRTQLELVDTCDLGQYEESGEEKKERWGHATLESNGG